MLIGVILGTCVLGLAGINRYPVIDDGELVGASAAATVLLLAPLMIPSIKLAAMSFCGLDVRPGNDRGWQVAFRWSILVLGVFMPVTVLVGVVNGRLDSGDSVMREQRVLAVNAPALRKRSTALVESWREGETRESIPVPYYFLEPLHAKGSKLRVFTKPGRFGIEWVERVELVVAR